MTLVCVGLCWGHIFKAPEVTLMSSQGQEQLPKTQGLLKAKLGCAHMLDTSDLALH